MVQPTCKQRTTFLACYVEVFDLQNPIQLAHTVKKGSQLMVSCHQIEANGNHRVEFKRLFRLRLEKDIFKAHLSPQLGNRFKKGGDFLFGQGAKPTGARNSSSALASSS